MWPIATLPQEFSIDAAAKQFKIDDTLKNRMVARLGGLPWVRPG